MLALLGRCEGVKALAPQAVALGPSCGALSGELSRKETSKFFKTKAHCTRAQVDAGVTTEWEYRGNAHADRFAKLGVALHGVGVEQYQLWFGLSF